LDHYRWKESYDFNFLWYQKTLIMNISIAMAVIVITYVIPAAFMWNYTRVQHSKGGGWSFLDPDGTDLFFTLFPIINVVITTSIVCDGTYNALCDRLDALIASIKQFKCPLINYNKFFCVKK